MAGGWLEDRGTDVPRSPTQSRVEVRRTGGLTSPARRRGADVDRHWLLTWTTYGTWLPGDVRGFVGSVVDADDRRTIHNVPGTPHDADLPGLRQYALSQLKCDPIWLDI